HFELALALLQIFERTLLDVLHHIVRRVRIPAHVEQLHDIAIGREERQLLDFARQNGPVQTTRMRVELDRDLAAGGSIERYPDFAIRASTQKASGLVAWHLGWGTRGLQAQRLSPQL